MKIRYISKDFMVVTWQKKVEKIEYNSLLFELNTPDI